MHNIRTNFGRFYRICKEFFEDQADSSGNLQFYPRAPKMSDLQIIALSCVMEALGIDSENLLWSKLNKDYPYLFQQLIDRSRFNRRRKRLQSFISSLQDQVCRRLEDQSKVMVIDSIPVPVAGTIKYWGPMISDELPGPSTGQRTKSKPPWPKRVFVKPKPLFS